MSQISTKTRRDRVVLSLHLVLVYFLAVGANCYVYLPFRHVKEATNKTTTLPQETRDVKPVYDNTKWTEGQEFQVIFYVGLGLGSVIGGMVGYFFSPRRGTMLLAKLVIMWSLIGACIINYSIVAHHIVWFFLALLTFALHVCHYVHTLESVPNTWVTYVGIGLFGISWTSARLYSIMLGALVGNWQTVFFWNTFLLFSVITLQDVVIQGESRRCQRRPRRQ